MDKSAFELTEVTETEPTERVQIPHHLRQFINHMKQVKRGDTPVSRLFSTPAGDKLLND